MKNNKSNETALVLRNDIYQSNPMIQARKDFDVIGMRVFFLGLRGINPHFSERDKYFDAEFNRLFVPTNKLTELFGGNTKYLSELKKACSKLFDAIVELNYEDGGFKLMHMFDELEYKPREGLYLQFSRKMRPYILDLFQSRGYTRINVEYLFTLSSPYAVRLLELLLQYQNIREFKEMMEIKRKMTVAEIRFALNVPENAYVDRLDNFKKYVLDDPIKEINKRTPYIVRYKTVKEGRSVVAFEFTMDTYNVPKDGQEILKSQFSNDAIKTLCSLGFTERIARAIFAKCYDAADCFSRINRAQELLTRNKRPIKNKLGFLRKAIEENWQVGPPEQGHKKERRGTEKDIDSSRAQKNIEHRAPSTADTSMTPIGQIFNEIFQNLTEKKPLIEQTPQSTQPRRPSQPPQPIKIGQKQMKHGLAKALIDAIRSKQNLDLVEEHLKEYNTTFEKFTTVCEKHGL